MGWRGVPTGAGLVDGGVDQGPCLQEKERVDGSSKAGLVRRGSKGVREGLAWRSAGGARASVPGG